VGAYRVQHVPVVRNENETAFAAQIIGHKPPPRRVEVVCGFVYKQKRVLFLKQRGQLQLRPLAVRQRVVRIFQPVQIKIEQIKLALQPPLLKVGANFKRGVVGGRGFIINVKRKIFKINVGDNFATSIHRSLD
jgi:hypothetical protein